MKFFFKILLVTGFMIFAGLSLTSRQTAPAKLSVEEVTYVKVIKKFNPRLPSSVAHDISKEVIKIKKHKKIDPELIIAILQTESSLNPHAISSTGDFSVAQINYEIWSKELERLDLDPLDKEKLKTDSRYALQKMGEILDILKKRYPDDPFWYARYHSSTPKFKNKYLKKVKKHLKIIQSAKK